MASRLALVSLFAAALVAPTRALAAPRPACEAAGWPQFGRTAAHVGTAPPGARIGSTTIGSLRRVWTASIGYGNIGAVDVGSSPLVRCGRVFMAASDGRVYAFDASTGLRLWRTPAVGHRFFGAAIGHGTLFAASDDGRVYAYATATGRPVWSASVTSLLGGAPTAPLVIGSTVYVLAAPALLTALDARSGAVRWTASVGDSSFLSIPAASKGMIYAGVGSSLVAVDATSGAVQWSSATGDVVWSTPTLAGGSVYVGSSDHAVHAFDAATGTPRWTGVTGDRVYASAPVASDGRVYVGSLDDEVHAFDEVSGTAAWTFPTGAAVTGSPAVAGGIVFIGSLDGTFYAIDDATGAPRWSDAVGQPIGSSPAIGLQSVYITTARKLIAYRVS